MVLIDAEMLNVALQIFSHPSKAMIMLQKSRKLLPHGLNDRQMEI